MKLLRRILDFVVRRIQEYKVMSMHKHNTAMLQNHYQPILDVIPKTSEDLEKLVNFSYNFLERFTEVRAGLITIDISMEIKRNNLGDYIFTAVQDRGRGVLPTKVDLYALESIRGGYRLVFYEGGKGEQETILDSFLDLGFKEKRARELTTIMFLNTMRNVYLLQKSLWTTKRSILYA